jgi:hypothetical protein
MSSRLLRFPRLATLAFALLVTGSAHGADPEGLPAAPALAPDAPPAAAAPAGAVDEAYQFRLRELEEKVVNLKDKVFRSKTRLMLLKERLLNDVIAEAKVLIFHRNDMGANFKPVSALYYLDGEKIWFADENSGLLTGDTEIETFNQSLAPGNHVLSVEMIYRGDSSLFAYLEDYEFKLRASYTFYATKGKITAVRSVGYQRGDITWDLRERPSITFEIEQSSYTSAEAEKALDTGGPSSPPPDASGGEKK